MNTNYLWPFDKNNQLGDDIRVLDIHGRTHVQACDPGLWPSFLYDFGKARAREAWLQTVQRGLNGSADGFYADCYTDRVLKVVSVHNDNAHPQPHSWPIKIFLKCNIFGSLK